jgi:RHS repeat-associated protein
VDGKLSAAAKLAYNIRFAGQVFDGQAGLHQNHMRDYDPAVGRFVESDPIGLVGGINTYAYVGDGPLVLIDPTGLCECEPTKRRYSSQTSAARDKIRLMNPLSSALNREHCGNVCKDKKTGQYFTTGAVLGTVSGCSPSEAPCPDCSYWVAIWHTHGGPDPRFDGEVFSPSDENYADKNHVDNYVGTPEGQFKHYPSRSGAPYSRGPL